MKQGKFILLNLIVALSLVFALFTAASAATSSVIDFEGLTEGSIVSSLSFGNGISGDPVAGTVSVFGFNPERPGNMAMIFDAECLPSGTPADCTGDDDDLYFQGHGNVLIISLDGDSSDPDDADFLGMYFDFDFSGFGPETVTVESLDVMDIEFSEGEDGGSIQLFSGGVGGTLLGTFPLPNTGDNGLATVVTATAGVDFMRVNLNGSGAIDNIEISTEEPPPPGEQGCTPGYWKNHLDSWAPTGFSPNQTLESVFDVPDSLGLDSNTLAEALDFPGGSGVTGGARILLRAAVAALLNASHPDVDYTRTASEVIADVNAALASLDRDTMIELAGELDFDNNLGCPLD